MVVFARWARKRVGLTAPARREAPLPDQVSPVRGAPAALAATSYTDPAAQVALVEQALEKLDAVRSLVVQLPEIPLGDRQSLLAQLSSTVESLRSLTFLDAIY